MMKRYFILLLIMIPIMFSARLETPAQRPTGSITGRVITDDGQPVQTARVTLVGAGGSSGLTRGRAMILTDEEGNFKIDGLDAMPYRIFVYSPGYVAADQENFSGAPVAGTVSSNSYRIGDFVTVSMTRGAVITGRVLTANGEPVVGIYVRVLKVREHDGRPPVGDPGPMVSLQNKTDDRGIYRIYGLAPGSYVVIAGGGAFSGLQTPFDAKAPVYHPSSTRETAAELTVRNGEELSGIDIRYRADRGFAVSGRVTGAETSVRSQMSISLTTVSLRRASGGEVIAQAVIPPNSPQNGFAFYGIAPGEYELEALRGGPQDDNPMFSEARKVTVTAADVSGVTITMTAAPSLAGTVVFEEKKEETPACPQSRKPVIEETQIIALRNDTGEEENDRNTILTMSNAPSPNAKGEFTVRGLRAAHYRLRVSLPSDALYVKSVELTGREPARDGLIVRAGERVTGLRITAAWGAASLSGKYDPGEGRPPGLRAHLVPQEPEAKDDVLRYYEVPLEGLEYKFTNLAPGKYRLVFKTGGRAPLAWNPAERAALRKEAEETGNTLELESCK